MTVPRPRGARNSELGGLSCFNTRNCMAVGSYENGSGHFLPFAARWHSGKWQLLATPAVPAQRETNFQGISCPTATLCMAAGYTEDNTRGRYFHAFTELWSGGKWHVSTLRKPPSLFFGISCPARNRCFASGYTFPVTDDVRAPADRDLERPDLGDAASRADRRAALRRRADACVVRQPVGLRGRGLPVQAEYRRTPL